MNTRMIRMTWPAAPTPLRTLSEAALTLEIEHMTDRNFADAPHGPITIEALDEHHCVSFRAYYSSPQQLVTLLKTLRGERPSGARPLVPIANDTNASNDFTDTSAPSKTPERRLA